jgi:hypothetical protein
MKNEIPYKIYLEENELPKKWLNLRAFMDKKPAPLLNAKTLKFPNARIYPYANSGRKSLFCR